MRQHNSAVGPEPGVSWSRSPASPAASLSAQRADGSPLLPWDSMGLSRGDVSQQDGAATSGAGCADNLGPKPVDAWAKPTSKEPPPAPFVPFSGGGQRLGGPCGSARCPPPPPSARLPKSFSSPGGPSKPKKLRPPPEPEPVCGELGVGSFLLTALPLWAWGPLGSDLLVWFHLRLTSSRRHFRPSTKGVDRLRCPVTPPSRGCGHGERFCPGWCRGAWLCCEGGLGHIHPRASRPHSCPLSALLAGVSRACRARLHCPDPSRGRRLVAPSQAGGGHCVSRGDIFAWKPQPPAGPATRGPVTKWPSPQAPSAALPSNQLWGHRQLPLGCVRPAPQQHLAPLVVRSVFERLWLARCSLVPMSHARLCRPPPLPEAPCRAGGSGSGSALHRASGPLAPGRAVSVPWHRPRSCCCFSVGQAGPALTRAPEREDR